MKTLYKIALALGITEYTYLIVMLFNIDKIDLTSIAIMMIIGISGFSCWYKEWYKKDDALNVKEVAEWEVLWGVVLQELLLMRE